MKQQMLFTLALCVGASTYTATAMAQSSDAHSQHSSNAAVTTQTEETADSAQHEAMDHADMEHSDVDHGDMEHGDMNHEQMNHENMDHAAMNHGTVDHSEMDHSEMPHGEMNHSDMDHSEMNHGEIDHSAMNMEQGMDHSAMNMQQSNATGDRSPHAYADGLTLEQGPFALPPSARLRLADEHNFGRVILNRLEFLDTSPNSSTRYDVQGWFGKDYNRFVLKAEGEISDGELEDSKTELLYSRAVSTFWDTQVGVRIDNGEGPSRTWLAAGVQGLAPYWFDVHATVFAGENGRTAFGFEAEYEARITQRLILKPRFDMNVYGKDDSARGIGSGLSDATVGLRLSYQFTRQIEPYIGVESMQKFGNTADLLEAGIDQRDTRWVAGLRLWF